LFSALKAADYVWEAVTPERLLLLRKSIETKTSYGPLERFFGIGLTDQQEARDELMLYGMSESDVTQVLSLQLAVTRVGDLFVPHCHWPPVGPAVGLPVRLPLASMTGSLLQDYVHLGPESLELLKFLDISVLTGARILDLGSGSGVHSMWGVQNGAKKTLGLEISSRAVEWSNAAAIAQGLRQSEFKVLRIGTPEADSAMMGTSWNLVISNPPLAVPSPGESRPHRDGGDLGVELPLLFLNFASRHLEQGGDAFFTVTNPIVRGKPVFFDRLDRKKWEVVTKIRLTDRFNASLHRKEGYRELGIESIELWSLHLKLLAN
jgi:SAM-dependent methyltransferase